MSSTLPWGDGRIATNGKAVHENYRQLDNAVLPPPCPCLQDRNQGRNCDALMADSIVRCSAGVGLVMHSPVIVASMATSSS